MCFFPSTAARGPVGPRRRGSQAVQQAAYRARFFAGDGHNHRGVYGPRPPRL